MAPDLPSATPPENSSLAAIGGTAMPPLPDMAAERQPVSRAQSIDENPEAEKARQMQSVSHKTPLHHSQCSAYPEETAFPALCKDSHAAASSFTFEAYYCA